MPNEGDFPNLLEEANALEWAGIGFPREDLYRLQFAMRQLLEEYPLKSVRLFGKIMGLKKDYLIIESEFKDGEGDVLPGTPPPEVPVKNANDSEDEDEIEAKEKEKQNNNATPGPQAPVVPSEEFTGTNKFTYWVCNEIGEQWIRLPNVTPSQVSIARKIHKYLTGDLAAELRTTPTFPGKERNYLRAQIARIAASTTLCPKGYLVFEDEGEDVDDDVILINDPDFVGHPPSAMLDLSNWVHQHEYILPQGRCAYYRLPRSNNEEEEEVCVLYAHTHTHTHTHTTHVSNYLSEMYGLL